MIQNPKGGFLGFVSVSVHFSLSVLWLKLFSPPEGEGAAMTRSNVCVCVCVLILMEPSVQRGVEACCECDELQWAKLCVCMMLCTNTHGYVCACENVTCESICCSVGWNSVNVHQQLLCGSIIINLLSFFQLIFSLHRLICWWAPVISQVVHVFNLCSYV